MSSVSAWIKPSRGGPSISFATCPVASLKPDWDASATFVFAVGILQWQNSERWSPMHAAADNRVDAQFVQFFRDCGVPERRIIYLQDEDATCSAVLSSLSHLVQQAPPDSTFFFYWAGHGHWQYQTDRYTFVAYDADINTNDCSNHIAMHDVVDLFSKLFRGKHVFLLADCCYSGGLCVAAHDISKSSSLNCSMACMTSSYSGSTGNWTFTDSLLEVLRGYPHTDIDDDGSVSFADAQTCSSCTCISTLFTAVLNCSLIISQIVSWKWRFTKSRKRNSFTHSILIGIFALLLPRSHHLLSFQLNLLQAVKIRQLKIRHSQLNQPIVRLVSTAVWTIVVVYRCPAIRNIRFNSPTMRHTRFNAPSHHVLLHKPHCVLNAGDVMCARLICALPAFAPIEYSVFVHLLCLFLSEVARCASFGIARSTWPVMMIPKLKALS
jgi:hypothetical protein